MEKKSLYIALLCLISSRYIFAECDHKYIMKNSGGEQIVVDGVKFQGCYAKNYTDYTPQQAANEFLKDQVFVKGGRFNLNNNPKTFINIPSFYMEKYLVPYQEYNAYLKATNQWNHGIVDGAGKYNNARKSFDIYNGLYPAKATYENAKGFCKWMGKQTGLDVTLPNYQQWLYAGTSKGTNWKYPTNNGKLEVGVNYPLIQEKGSNTNTLIVTDNPVNSLGIHQIFGNGYQWSSSILSKSNAPYFNIGMGKLGWRVLGGSHYPTSDISVKLLKQVTLSSDFAISVDDTREGMSAEFRCVINTDKPLPKSVN